MNDEKSIFGQLPDVNNDGKHDAVDYLIFEEMMHENERENEDDSPDEWDGEDLDDLDRLDEAPDDADDGFDD